MRPAIERRPGQGASDRARRLLAWRRAACGLLACGLLLPALGIPPLPRALAADSGPAAAGQTCRRPPVVGRLPRGAELDSAWFDFGRYLSGCRIVNRRHRWVVSDGWFELTHGPERFVNLASLDSMNTAGDFPDSVPIPIVGVRYRFLVSADSLAQARRAAQALRPHAVPQPVASVLREMRARAERDSNPTWY